MSSSEEENVDASMVQDDDDDHDSQEQDRPQSLTPPDADTIRIIVSTDNHLGYNERDAVRGLDSFAALEEVLYLAKELQADMVLLAGDLFHDNKPSRRTLHKTMQLFRTYCMGPNPVQIQILNNIDSSNSNSNDASSSVFRQGHVNYEDEHYSVDLPIFAIHGNHDDPTREGGNGSELLAALDLLDAANLVNYIGRQEQVNQISIEPVLVQKGITHLALYGMGSMRDERLNRMWQSQKVQFARPAESTTADGEPQPWFNLFALHQNRDLGRGTKNCVHESMIPEWMDLVVWGHEHECCIEPEESVVGTFRITQPGSSVATSLSVGESSIKKIGVLDVRGSHFRLLPIPLTQVRSFVLGEVRLTDQRSLDPEDPKVEPKITQLLEDQVRLLVYQAREKTREVWQAAKDAGNLVARAQTMPLANALEKPDEVLVRIKVEHSGFSTLNNQRFGAKFIGQVANPSDILLFHRKKSAADPSKSSILSGLPPMAPEELEEMNIEDLICEQLDNSDKKLELFDQKRMGGAVESYVQKQQARAITDALSTLLEKQQKVLLNNKVGGAKVKDEDDDDDDDEQEMKGEEDEDDEDDESPAKKAPSNKRNRATSRKQEDQDDEQDLVEYGENGFTTSKRGWAATTVKAKTTTRKPAASRSKPIASTMDADMESDDMIDAPPPKAKSRAKPSAVSRKPQVDISDDEEEEVEAIPPPKASRARAATTKRATTAKSRVNYKVDSDDDVIDIDKDSEEDDAPPPPKKSRGRAPAAAKTKRMAATTTKAGSRSQQSSGRGMSQSQISFAPQSSRKAKVKYTASSDEEVTPKNRSYEDLEEDWGTANTNTQS